MRLQEPLRMVLVSVPSITMNNVSEHGSFDKGGAANRGVLIAICRKIVV